MIEHVSCGVVPQESALVNCEYRALLKFRYFALGALISSYKRLANAPRDGLLRPLISMAKIR